MIKGVGRSIRDLTILIKYISLHVLLKLMVAEKYWLVSVWLLTVRDSARFKNKLMGVMVYFARHTKRTYDDYTGKKT